MAPDGGRRSMWERATPGSEGTRPPGTSTSSMMAATPGSRRQEPGARFALGTKEWHAIPPYFHAWNNRCHTLAGGTGEASWDLDLRGPGTYTIQAWWAAAPGAKDWTHQAVYEVVAGGKIVASKTLDQTHAGDEWHTIAEGLKLEPGESNRWCGSEMPATGFSSPTPCTFSRPSGTTTDQKRPTGGAGADGRNCAAEGHVGTTLRGPARWPLAFFQSTPEACLGRPERREQLTAGLRRVLRGSSPKVPSYYSLHGSPDVLGDPDEPDPIGAKPMFGRPMASGDSPRPIRSAASVYRCCLAVRSLVS